jgi:hypothetical protein
MNPNDAAVQAISLLKRSALMSSVDPFYSLCVADRIVAERIILAKSLQEITNHSYHQAWIIKALLEIKEPDQALHWLSSNAPKFATSRTNKKKNGG